LPEELKVRPLVQASDICQVVKKVLLQALVLAVFRVLQVLSVVGCTSG
jgi:hypothetical protein